MKNLILLLFISTILKTNYVKAQVNIEKLRSQLDNKKSFVGMISGGLQLQKGNVNTSSYDLETLLYKNYQKHSFFLQFKNSQGQESNKNFKNETFSHVRWAWMTFKKLGPEIFFQAQHDEFKELILRQLSGIGIRYLLFENKNNNVVIGTSAMTDFEILETKNKNIDFRANLYFSALKKIDKNKKNFLQLTLYYQPIINAPDDARFSLESLIRTNLINQTSLFLDNSFIILYDSRPPNNVSKLDLNLKLNITYEW